MYTPKNAASSNETVRKSLFYCLYAKVEQSSSVAECCLTRRNLHCPPANPRSDWTDWLVVWRQTKRQQQKRWRACGETYRRAHPTSVRATFKPTKWLRLDVFAVWNYTSSCVFFSGGKKRERTQMNSTELSAFQSEELFTGLEVKDISTRKDAFKWFKLCGVVGVVPLNN